MSLQSQACDASRIAALIAGRASQANEALLEVHLSTCEACRDALHAATADQDIWNKAGIYLRDEIDELCPLSSAGNETIGLSGGNNIAHRVLESLTPSDDPEMLGRIGEYEISGVIGCGGMGAVLKGYDRSLKRVVAIKVMAPHLASSAAARRRFEREAQAAAAMTHDNVIEIYGVSEANGLPYLVMPYSRGMSLQKRIDQRGPLPTVEILRIGSQIAAGLAAAHAQGLVHRDIKPANILVSDGVDRLFITDFGLARAVDDASVTRTGVVAGTPQYMSPEQARGEPVDHRSDLFSLGTLLYTLCTGRPPFRAESAFGIMRRISDNEPRPIRDINPEIPHWLCGVIDKLHAKSPAERYQSAEELAILLQECLAHLQQPDAMPLPGAVQVFQRRPSPSKSSGIQSRSKSGSRRNVAVITMVAVFGFSLLGMFLWHSTTPSDISGKWSGEGWGQVELKETQSGKYEGTYTDTFGKEMGQIQLKWSRIEQRFKGTWQEGEDRRGKISVHLVDNEIRGAWTTSKKSGINPGNPELAELIWRRPAKGQEPERWLPSKGTASAMAVEESKGLATSDHEKTAAKLVLVFFQDESRRAVPCLLIDVGGQTFAITTGPATVVPEGTVPAVDRAFVEVAGKPPIPVEYDEHSTRELFVYRMQDNLSAPEFSPFAAVELKDSVSSSDSKSAPKQATVVALDQPAELELPERNIIHHYENLIEVDQSFAEGTPLFKDGKLVGLTLLGSRFVGAEANKSYVVPAERLVALCAGIEQETADSPHESTEASLQPIRRFADLATGHNVTIAYSADGKLIAIANGNPSIIHESNRKSRVADNWKPSVKILDAETGKTVASLVLTTAEEDAVLAATERVSHIEATALEFSPDGSFVAVGTSIGQVKLYNARTGELIKVLDDEAAKIADKETPENWKPLRRAMGSVASLKFSPDGSQLAMCGGSFADFAESFAEFNRMGLRQTGPGRLKLWDVKTGTLKHDLVGHNDQAYAVAFSPDGQLLASAGRWHEKSDMFGNGVIIWNAQTGEPIHSLIRTTASAGARSIAFSPDSKMLAMGSQRFGDDDVSTGGVSLVQVSSGVTDWLVTVPGWAKPVEFSPDGKSLAVLCGGKSIRFLETATGTLQQEIKPVPNQQEVQWNDFTIAEGGKLAIGGVDKERKGSIEVWNTQQGKNATAPASNLDSSKKRVTPTTTNQITLATSANRVASSADGRLIAVANGNPTFIMQSNGSSKVRGNWKPTAEIIDVMTGATIASLKLSSNKEERVLTETERVAHFEITALAFSPDGSKVAIGTSIGALKIFDAQTGELKQSLDDKHARLADTQTPENWSAFPRVIGSIRSLAFSPDGRLLAVCGDSFAEFSNRFDGIERLSRAGTGPGRLKVWEIESGKLKHDLDGHSYVDMVAFSPDGNLLASAGRWSSHRDDGNGVILWNPQSGTKIRTILTPANGGTHAVLFSPNSKLMAIGSRIFDNDNDTSATNVSLVRAGTGIVQWQQAIPGWASPKAFSPAGKSVVVLCGSQSIQFLDTESGSVTSELKADESPSSKSWKDLAAASQMMVTIGTNDEQKAIVEFWGFPETNSEVDSSQ
jgi:serine/threonine protein kinase/WD40 repeat protein